MERLTVILFIALIVIIAYNIIEIFLANKLYKKIEKEHQEEIDKFIDEALSKVTNIEAKTKIKKMRVRRDFLYIDTNGSRDLAGKIFVIDFEVTPDEVDEKARQGNPACFNFCMRRMDFTDEFNKKLYYGHITDDDGFDLGYVLCEDELEKVR